MFSKVLRVVIIYVLVYYILGFLLTPVYKFFQQVNLGSIILSFIIFAIEIIITFFIAQKFLTLKKGEARRIAMMLTVLSLALGAIAIFSQIWTVKTFNYVDNVYEQSGTLNNSSTMSTQSTPTNLYYLSIISELLQAVIIYYLGWKILLKSEVPW